MPARSLPSLTNQAAYLAASKVVGFFIGIALPMLLARALSPRDYGLFKQTFLVVGSIVGILPFGVGMSAFYFLARERDLHRAAIVNIIIFHSVVGALACTILLCFPRVLSIAFPDGRELVANAPWIGLLVLVTITSALLETVATANRDIRFSTIFLVGAPLSKALFMVVALLLSPTLLSLIQAALAQALVEGAVFFWYVNYRFPRYWRAFDSRFFVRQLQYALPLGFAGLLYIVQMELPSYFVSWRYGAVAFAFYAVGSFPLPLLAVLRDAVSSVLLSRVSGLQHEGNIAEIRRLNSRVTRKLMLVYFPSFALLELCGKDLLVFFYGQQYGSSWPIFRINLLMLPFSVFVNDPVLRAFAEHRYFLVILRIVSVILLVPGLWLFSKTFGLIGAMIGVVAFSIAERGILVFWVSRILSASRLEFIALGRAAGRIGASVIVATILGYATGAIFHGHSAFALLAIVGIVFSVTYFGAMIMCGALHPDELMLVRQFVTLRWHES